MSGFLFQSGTTTESGSNMVTIAGISPPRFWMHCNRCCMLHGVSSGRSFPRRGRKTSLRFPSEGKVRGRYPMMARYSRRADAREPLIRLRLSRLQIRRPASAATSIYPRMHVMSACLVSIVQVRCCWSLGFRLVISEDHA